MPSGNFSATKIRLFHVTGSRSQRPIRFSRRRSRRSRGWAIGTPSSARAVPRSIAAIARVAASVASRIPSPMMTTASAAPTEIPITSTTKYASPSGNAASR